MSQQYTYDLPTIEYIDKIKELQKVVNYLSDEIDKLKENNKEEVEVLFKPLTPTAKMPTQEHDGDIYDVYADEDVLITDGESKLVSTGIAFGIPEGYQLRVYNRSGNPLKYKLVLSNGTGIIDRAYTGILKGQFFTIDGTYQIKKGDKIMQLELVKVLKIKFKQVDELPKTDRGSNGFGSSGK